MQTHSIGSGKNFPGGRVSLSDFEQLRQLICEEARIMEEAFPDEDAADIVINDPVMLADVLQNTEELNQPLEV